MCIACRITRRGSGSRAGRWMCCGRERLRGQRTTNSKQQTANARWSDGRLRGLVRLAQAMRYRRAGLGRLVRGIAPDVFHAHFVVEHGFYAAAVGFHPYVVTAWGSDVLVEPERDP